MSDGDTQNTPVRPALKTLQHDQRALLADDVGEVPALREGFVSRRGAINWYQAAIVRTFGYLADEWPALELSRDRVLLQSLVVSEARNGWAKSGAKPVSLSSARDVRDRLETSVVRPSCNKAYNMLRKTAGEYIDNEEKDMPTSELDPEQQAHVAMRPAFQQKDHEQRRTLEELWGGFEDVEAIRDWCNDLDGSTNGAIDADFSRMVADDTIAVEHLLAGETGREQLDKQVYRERLAIHALLPAFVTGVKRMNAGELAKRTTGQSGTHTFD